jgi:hypothetical protein
MYGVKGIRFALRMVPTPEQMLEIRTSMEKAFAAHGIVNRPLTFSGIGEEQILTIDEAIEVLREYKALEDAIPVPAPRKSAE